MNRRHRILLVLVALGAVVAPGGAAAEACTSGLPVLDKRMASFQCAGVHPGMLLSVPSLKWGELDCTAGYAFADQFGQRYLTFPGTCYLDYDCLEDTVTEELPPPLSEIVPTLPTCLMPSESELEPYYRRGGPVVRDGEGRRVGVLVYAVNKKDINFAIVRVDAGRPVSPAVPLYGGPRRLGAPSTAPEEAYSYSASRGPEYPNARTGLLHTTLSNEAVHAAEGFLSTAPGSPVLKPDGTAVGMYTGMWTVALGWEVEPLGAGVARAASRTKLNLRLLTAPLA